MAGPTIRVVTPPPVDSDARLVRQFVIPEGVDLQLRLGSAGERLAAFLLDMVIIAVVAIVLILSGVAALAATHTDAGEAVEIVIIAGLFLLRSGWFMLWELTPRAATPGKMALGLRVAARDGGRLTGEAIFTRNAMREIEVFLPLSFLTASSATGDAVDGWLQLMGILWTGIFALFPLFNRDRLRVGDFMAGTWVVKAPRKAMLVDLAADAAQRLPRFAFSDAQVQAYGVKELQVLEEVLRRSDIKTMAAVAERIRTKIAWITVPGEADADFLAAYYAALRGRLENRLLFGHRRKDKFDTA